MDFILLGFVFYPFFSFIFSWVSFFILGEWEILWLMVHFYVIIVIVGSISLWEIVIFNEIKVITLSTWIKSGLFVVNWGFIFDTLSVSMLLMVAIVSGSVHYYSLGYMCLDPSLIRFISYLSLFTFFMFILFTGDNFIQLFLGWEGIGACSYLLISFWNTRVQANKSALKALIVNRIGDFGFICGLVLIFYFFRSVDFFVVFSLAPFLKDATFFFLGFEFFCLDVICCFLFLGCVGKSAQLGLHTWLPSAMEGPTPVSALIHAATLVTAGIFLIIRCSVLFEFAPLVLFVILIIGGLTAFFSATVAVTQDDIKRVIAFSTCSQLGYMIFICGLSGYSVSLFHLINHAFFKALLFLAAGSVIHSMSGDQDMRKFGSLIKFIPYTYSMMLLGFLALSGFPFLSGFYSKDLILELAFSKYNVLGVFSYWLGSISAGLTAFYSFRVVYYTFVGKNISFRYYSQQLHELPENMGLSLFFLSFGSLFSGFFLKDMFVGVGSPFWGNAIYISDNFFLGLDLDFIPLIFKNVPLIFSLSGIVLGLLLNTLFDIWKSFNSRLGNTYCGWSIVWNDKVCKPQASVIVYRFLNYEWYFDYVYNYYIGYTILELSYSSFYKLLDKTFFELWGSKGFILIFYTLSKKLSNQSLGYIYHSGSLLLIGLLMLVFVFLSL